jgi:2-desacetyl-2-hydroxyethyl bacteriochlorophyllide A dehydrogenase
MAENLTVRFGEGEAAVVETPRPTPGEGEVVVETTRSLISTGTELAELAGKVPWDPTAEGHVPGYSAVGTVVEAGPGAGEWEGRRVAVPVGHQRYALAATERCRPVPDGVGDEAATFFRLVEIAMNGVRRGRVDWGETVAVYGQGLVGQLALRACLVAGVRTAVGIDLADGRLDHLPDHPAVVAANPRREDPAERVREACGGPAEVVVEATASVDAIPGEFDALAREGRFVLLSSPRESGEFDYYEHCHRHGYELVGAHVSTHPDHPSPATPWTAPNNAALFFELLEQGRFAVDDLITHRDPAERAPERYGALLADRTRHLGCVLEW